MDCGFHEPDRSSWPVEALNVTNALQARVAELTEVLQERAAYTDKLVEDLAELRHELVMMDVQTEAVSPQAEPMPTLRPIAPSSPAPSGHGELEFSQGSANLQDVCTMSQRSTSAIEALHSKAQQESAKIVEFLQRITALQEEGVALNENAYRARSEGESHRRQSLAFQCRVESLTSELEQKKLELRQAQADKEAAEVSFARQGHEVKEREHDKERELSNLKEETARLKRQLEELQKELDWKDDVKNTQAQIAEKEARTWQERCHAAEAAHKKLCTDMSRRVEEHAAQLTAEATRYEELRKEIEESRRRGDLTSDLHRASTEVIAATQARQVVEQKVASLEGDLRALQVQYSILSEQNNARAEQQSTATEAYTTELESLREQLQAAQQQAASLSEEVATHISATHAAQEEAKKARDEASVEAETRADAVERLRAETSKKIAELESQLLEAAQQRDSLERNMSQERVAARAQVGELEKQVEEQKIQIGELTQQLESTRQQHELAMAQKAAVDARVTDLEKQLATTEEDLRVAQGEAKEAVREAAELRGELKGVTESLTALRAEREADARRFSSELEAMTANLRQTAETAKNQATGMTETQNAMTALKTQIEHLEQRLQTANTATAEAHSQHEDTKRQLSQLQHLHQHQHQQHTSPPSIVTLQTPNHVPQLSLVQTPQTNHAQPPLNLVQTSSTFNPPQSTPVVPLRNPPIPLVATAPIAVSNGIRPPVVPSTTAVPSPPRDSALMPAPQSRPRNPGSSKIETIEVQDTQDSEKHSQGNGGEVMAPPSRKRPAEGEAEGAPPQARATLKGKPVISLSGFKNSEHGYTLADKQRALKLVKELGGEVTKDQGVEALDEKVTHVIAPASARTVKILAAALSGKWIMPVEWLWACADAKQFTEEASHGFCGASNLVREKKYFASSGLQKARLEQVHQLVQGYGGGSSTNEISEADFIFIKSNDERLGLGAHKPGAEVRTFDEFVHWVYKAAKEGPPKPR